MGKVAVPKTVQKPPSPRDNLYPTARSLPVCAGAHTSLSLPLSAAIDLHEIHLARQPSLQVPEGHIPVPGGIKLCSPGTFGVANYLIINDGSCQVNFTKHAVGWSSCRNTSLPIFFMLSAIATVMYSALVKILPR